MAPVTGPERNDDMGITKSTKELSTTAIPCGGRFQVTLSLTAEPEIVSHIPQISC